MSNSGNDNGKNYYEILEIDPKSSKEDIDIAYKKLAMKWHPDKNKNNRQEAEMKFMEISKAYQVLSNEESRKRYDSYGVATTGTGNMIDPYDILKDVFDTEDNNIPNVIVGIEADIDKLYTGFTEIVKFTRFNQCKKCNANGTRDGKPADCNPCKGRGIVIEKTKGGKIGFMMMEKKCDSCDGNGIDPDVKICKKCNGNKYVKEDIECEVDIPPGAYDKYYLKLEDEGNYIPKEDRKTDKNRTDVIIVVSEKPSTIPGIRRGMFIQELNRVNRADILMTVDISFAESIMGIKKVIPFLASESISIEIDDVIQHGDIHVIKGKGMPIVPEELEKHRDKSTTHGDLFIQFKVEKPVLTSQKRKRMWQIITDTSYPQYDDIDNPLQCVSFEEYVDEQKKLIKNISRKSSSDDSGTDEDSSERKNDSDFQSSDMSSASDDSSSDEQTDTDNDRSDTDSLEEELKSVLSTKNNRRG